MSTSIRSSRSAIHAVSTLLATGTAAVVLALVILHRFSPVTVAAEPPVAAAAETTAAEPTASIPQRKAGRLKPAITTGSMHIAVVDAAGQPLPGAKIHVCVPSSTPWADVDGPPTQDYDCDANGQTDVAIPKSVRLLSMWASAHGGASLGAEWSPTKNGELVPDAFTFRLPKGTTIGGIVTDPEGQPIQGARVEVKYDRAWVARGADAKTTDAAGHWTLDNVPPDDALSFTIKLARPDFISDMGWGGMQRKQHVTAEALRAQTAKIVMQRGTTVTGTLTDPDGKPVPGAVVLWGEHPLAQHFSQQEVRTDEAGRFRFPPLPNGLQAVTVIAQGWRPELRMVDVAPNIPPVDFQLQPGKKLRLRFTDPAGSPVPDIAVYVARWRWKISLYNRHHPSQLNTGIPIDTKEGIYEWNWAPDDVVTYLAYPTGASADKFVYKQIDLAADDQEHVEILLPRLQVAGTVTDAQSGQPIPRFTVMPIKLGSAQRDQAQDYSAGQYSLSIEPQVHALRIEADGYRTALSQRFEQGKPIPSCDFRLQPAPLMSGRVVDGDGQPAAGAKVFLATRTQRLDIVDHVDTSIDRDVAVTDDGGSFAFPAQSESYRLVALDDRGYAEIALPPDQLPGDLKLAKWARVEGRLFQAGQPVAKAPVRLEPLRIRKEGFSDITDMFIATTDDAGHFAFDRVPPMRFSLMAMLGRWDDRPTGTSESVPLDLKPGDQITQDLGTNGALVRGRVTLKGETAGDLDVGGSKGWLAPKARDNDLLETDAWPDLQIARRKLRHHYYVQVAPDGTFLISGVPAGEYDLVLSARAQGCPVRTNGLLNGPLAQLIPIHVAEADVTSGTLDLGLVTADAPAGPKPGEAVPDVNFVTLDDNEKKLSDFSGRYVLLQFWTKYCGKAVANLPAVNQIQDQFGPGGRLVVVGLSLAPEEKPVRQFFHEHPQSWLQGFLPDRTDIYAQFGVNAVPTYFLIDPAGKLISKHYSIDTAKKEIATLLDTAVPAVDK